MCIRDRPAAKVCEKLGLLLEPVWHIFSLVFRWKTALACTRSYDVAVVEKLGPNAIDTGDLILFSSAGKGLRKFAGCSRWTHIGMVIRNPPPDLVTFVRHSCTYCDSCGLNTCKIQSPTNWCRRIRRSKTQNHGVRRTRNFWPETAIFCLLYTSDAADE